MPTFTTPGPVALRVRLEAGHLTVTASDRTDTIVAVVPANPARDVDVESANATIVEQHGDEIRVLAPESKFRFGRTPKLEITVEVPTASAVTAAVATAPVELAGALGDVEVTTATGDVAIEHATAATVATASAAVVCHRVEGDLYVKSASGDVRFGDVTGGATVTTASGDIVGTAVGGDAEIRTASGDARLDAARGSLLARTASGDLHIGAVQRGTVEVDTASGDISIAVVPETAAWLDVQSLSGDVSSSLDQSGPPGDGVEVVSIHARSISGDISIRRAARSA